MWSKSRSKRNQLQRCIRNAIYAEKKYFPKRLLENIMSWNALEWSNVSFAKRPFIWNSLSSIMSVARKERS